MSPEFEAHAQRSMPSEPPELHQPVHGLGSFCASRVSWPPTMLTPSRRPALPEFTKFLPQEAPASVMYGKYVTATLPEELLRPSWYAHQRVPKPLCEWPEGVATM